MALIEVNHHTLCRTAQAIEDYCTEQDQQMKTADARVKDMLCSHWHGPDAVDFGRSWQEVDAAGSTAVTFQKSMESFANALTASAAVYRKAQEDVYNLSCTLPR